MHWLICEDVLFVEVIPRADATVPADYEMMTLTELGDDWGFDLG